MIRNFRCRDTESLFDDRFVRRFQGIERAARRKLEILEAVERLEDLRVPPGNRLEALRGERKGQHSIRIIDQHRDSPGGIHEATGRFAEQARP